MYRSVWPLLLAVMHTHVDTSPICLKTEPVIIR